MPMPMSMLMLMPVIVEKVFEFIPKYLVNSAFADIVLLILRQKILPSGLFQFN